MAACIFSTVNQAEAGLLKGALDEKNIENFIKNFHSNALGISGWTVPLAGANTGLGNIEVYVRDEDAKDALEVVNALFGVDNG